MFFKRQNLSNAKANDSKEEDKIHNKNVDTNKISIKSKGIKKTKGMLVSKIEAKKNSDHKKPSQQANFNKNFSRQISLKNFKEKQLDQYFKDHLPRMNRGNEDIKYDNSYLAFRDQVKNLYLIPKQIDVDVIPQTSEFDEKAIWARGMVETPITTEERLNFLIGIEDSKRKILHKNVLLEVRKKLNMS